MKLGCFLMGILIYFFTSAIPVAHAVTLNFDPLSADLAVGEVFNVDINISGLSDIEDLSVFDFNVDYDNSLLDFNGYTLGGYLGSSFDIISNLGGGQINLSEVSLEWDLNSQPDAFSLATVSFTAKAAGASTIGLSDILLGDFLGDPLSLDPSPSSLPFTIAENGFTAVPEPSTILLLGGGLLGLGWYGRKRKKA